MTVARAARKEDRLEIRVQPAQRRLLDQAAAASNLTTSAFVLSHATEAAQQLLADRTLFVLPEDRWQALVELLERPEQPVEGLARLLAGPSVEELE
ncbi:MAG: DUF1778 domain-containing protein [Chloroflexota bacterium]